MFRLNRQKIELSGQLKKPVIIRDAAEPYQGGDFP